MAGPVLWQQPGAGGVISNPNLPGGDPYALPYGDAGKAVEDQRRRSLEAMSTAGTAGRQYVADAQSAIEAKRAQAVNMALAESRQRGSDQAAQDVVASRINEPYQHRSASLDQGSASRSQDIAYRQAGNDNYFSQVAPAVQAGHDRMLGSYQRERARQDAERAYQQAQLEQQIAQAKYEAEQDRMEREWNRQQALEERAWQEAFAEKKFGWEQTMDERNFQQELEQARLAAARARSSGGGGSGGGGSSGYYGTGFTKTELKDQFPGLVRDVRSRVDPGNLMGSKIAKLTGFDKTLQGGVAGNVARAIGIPAAAGQSMLGKYSTGLKQNNQGMYDAQGKPIASSQGANVVYQQTYDVIQQQLEAGASPTDIIRQARSSGLYGSDPTAVNRAISDALPGWS